MRGKMGARRGGSVDQVSGTNNEWAAPGAAEPTAPAPPTTASPGAPIPPPPTPSTASQPHVVTPHAAPLTYRSWQPGIVALRPLNFGDFLTVPFKAFRFNRAVTVGGPTLFTLLSAAATVVAGWLLFNDPQLGFTDFNPNPRGIEVTTVIALIVAALSWFATDMFATAIVLPGIARAVLGEKITLGQAWKTLVPRIPQLLLLYLIVGAGTVVVSAIALLPTILGITQDNGALMVFGWFLYFLFLVPLAMVLGVYLPAVRGALVLERVPAVAALRRGIHLMKKRFWWTVLILFVCVAILGVVTQIVQTAAQFAWFIVIAAAPDDGLVMAIGFASSYGLSLVLANIITYAFLGSVYSLLYIDGRMRREGFEVELARAAEARHQPSSVVVG